MRIFENKQRGFTLVELMVTIVVVSIVLAVGIPSIAQLRRNSEVSTATNELIAALHYARSEAVRRGEDVELAPIGAWGAGWRVGIELDDDANRVVYRRFEPPPATITFAGPAVITFEAMGNVTAASCVELEIDGLERSIQLSASGRISNQHAACP